MPQKVYGLATFGLSKHEMLVLQTISIISRNRPRCYALVKVASDVPDFALVDDDDPQARASWLAFQANNPAIRAIMVGRTPPAESIEPWIGRPLKSTQLLTELDRLEPSKERPAFVAPQAAATGPRQRTPRSPVVQPLLDVANRPVCRALVVDDSLPIRRQVELELRRILEAVDVDLAESGERAIELLSAKRYDIVFLDVVLPRMDGYDICQTIKRDIRTKETPVVMLTGKSSAFNRIRGKLAGCDTYLTKPVDRDKFYKAVETLVTKRNGARWGAATVPRGSPLPSRLWLKTRLSHATE